jgi:hypothetical protein
MKKLMTTIAFGLLGITLSAQVPSYVPTSGLIGYFGFNNNGNDAISSSIPNSNTAVSTTDRFNIANSAYQFNGSNIIRYTNTSHPLFNIGNTYQTFSMNFWVNPSNTGNAVILGAFGWGYYVSLTTNNNILFTYISSSSPATWTTLNSTTSALANTWSMITITRSGTTNSIYINGVLNNTLTSAPNILVYANNNNCWFGANGQDNNGYLSGKLDDIGLWSRALTQQEITDLYNSINCNNNLTISPQNNNLNTGNNTSFSATTSDANPNYIWQSDFGQGFQTLNNFGSYSGANSATLSIANVQLPNHTQPIRVITTSGNCIDTSNVSVINILDTCLVTVYDTLLTTVTDTLVINAQITGMNPPNNLNTLKIFPNPASTHITIDYGNFSGMSGYTLKIVNAVGQTVFTTPINQQTSFIDLSTWTGNGIYFVQIIDTQNNTIENRKTVLQ